MVFHVTPSGRSFSQIKCISPSSDEDDDDDDDDSDSKNVSSRLKAEFSSSEKSCLIGVTSSNLRLNLVNLSKHFARANGLNKRCCEIDLINESSKSWALYLRHNDTTGQDYIRGGWRSFCRANELKPGSLYRFELVRNGTRPLLRLCSEVIRERNCSKANISEKYSREDESASMKQNNFLTVTFKDYMIKSGHIRLPRHFVRANGMKEKEEITLVDKTGVKWPSYLTFFRERGEFYVSKRWRRFCAANRFKEGEAFTLEFVRGEGTTPMLKFKVEQVPFDDPQGTVQASRDKEEEEEETEIRFQKRARVSAEGPSRCTRASNKSSADPGNLQPLQPCSISDQVTKVKQSVVDTLTNIRRFRSELKIKEQNLEASLLEIETLGVKLLEISKILE